MHLPGCQNVQMCRWLTPLVDYLARTEATLPKKVSDPRDLIRRERLKEGELAHEAPTGLKRAGTGIGDFGSEMYALGLSHDRYPLRWNRRHKHSGFTSWPKVTVASFEQRTQSPVTSV